MLNQGGITKVSANTRNTILFSPESAVAVSCKVANTGVEAVDGNKIVKAGTPLAGDLTARGTAFTVAADTEGVSNAVGIILHDVDVTSGTKNAQVVIFGFVDLNMVEASVVSAYTTPAKTALAGKIQFVK